MTVQAKDIAFVQATWTGPADKPFTIAFDNEDAGVPHNIEIKDASGAEVFKGEIFNGVETRVYDVPALPAGAVHVRLFRSPEHDRDRHAPVAGRRPCRDARSSSACCSRP